MPWKTARALLLGSSPSIAEVGWLVDVKYLFVCFLEIDLCTIVSSCELNGTATMYTPFVSNDIF